VCEGIESTVLVAHDYSVSVAQELLTRRAAATLAVDVRAVHFMNGGIYPDLHRPQPTQVALLDPVQGPQISAAMNGELFAASLAPTFPEGYDSGPDAAAIWQSFHLHDGQANTHLLIRYIEDRRENAERWTQVLETTDVPLTFVWGMLDPVSGAHMAERIRERLPGAPFTALEDVGHWPPLEAPERVVAALLDRRP
jgi:pimeloyl-ACP methyl ester carboxylesterase